MFSLINMYEHAYSIIYVPVITYHVTTLSQIIVQVWILWLRQDLLTLDHALIRMY